MTKRNGVVAYTNALLYAATRSMGELARAQGDTAEAAHCDQRAAPIKQQFNQTLWDDKAGYYQDSDLWSIGTYLWAKHELGPASEL